MKRAESHAESSDEIEEMYCEFCKTKGISRTAEGFCVDCVKYICTSCIESHSYFLPSHVHKDKTNMPQEVCVKPCIIHPAEIIKFYCSACEQFFCSICKQNDHSECSTVSHLPILVQFLDLTKTFNEVSTKLENTIEAVEKRESKVNKKLQNASENAKKAKSSVHLKKTLVLQWLERNVENIEKEIEEIQNGDEKTLQSEGSDLSAIKDQSNTLKTRLNSKNLLSKRCELFITLKDTEKDQKQMEEKLRQVEEHIVTCYEFNSSEDCEKLLQERTLGNIKKKSTTKNEENLSSTVHSQKESEISNVVNVTSSTEEANYTSEVVIANENMNEYGLPGVEMQKSIVAKHLQRPLILGEIWYLVDVKWFKQWKCYVGYDDNGLDTYYVGEESAHPGPIDNTPILEEGTSELKEHLLVDLDYTLVPEDCWKQLLTWYGIVEGQDALQRKVILEGVYTKSLKVEVYPWWLKLCENSDPDTHLRVLFSKSDTIGNLEKIMRDMFGIAAERQVRLWNRYLTNMYEQLKRKDSTLQEAGLYQGQIVVIEQQNKDGTWPRC